MRSILIGYVTESKTSGINKYLFNVIDSIKDDMIIDCITNSNNPEFVKRLQDQGIRNVYKINRLSHPFKRYTDMKNILRQNKYDVIYFNISEAFNCVCNIAAKKYSDAKIVTHSHSSNVDTANGLKRRLKTFVNTLCQSVVVKYSDYYYACSKLAGYWLYGKKGVNSSKFRVIRNTVDTNKFKFDKLIRDTIRESHNYSDHHKVVGFVGNFLYQKNIFFLLDVFKELKKINSDYRLMMVGSGELESQFISKLKEEKLEDTVLLTGRVPNVHEYMSAMDCFVLPSLFEGLPVVGVEAQVNGLVSVFADTITNEIYISNGAHFLSLEKGAKYWANYIDKNIGLSHQGLKYEDILIDCYEQVQEFRNIFINGNY